MPEPQTTPNEHDKPVFQPGKPTPEDPRQNTPVEDPPVHPEHDDVERVSGGQQADDPSPDRVLFDENRTIG